MWRAHARVLRRALLLYGLGLIYYGGISQHWADIRYLGVLQRLALCYLFASLLFLNFNLRGMIVAFVSLLLGYWALMTFVPVPGIGAGSFAPDANLANWIDAHYLPGRLWDSTRDPEGMLSTLPAIGTCLLGVFAGLLLKDERFTAQSKSLWLIGAGVALVAAGHLWGLQFPVIKAIWTSSFVLVAGGYSAILLGVWHQIIDVWGIRDWSLIFIWIGANAITLYFLNNVFGFEPFAQRFVGGDFRRPARQFDDAGNRTLPLPCAWACVCRGARGLFLPPQDFPASVIARLHVPTFSSDTSARRAATVDNGTMRPVRGFCDGMPSMVM